MDEMHSEWCELGVDEDECLLLFECSDSEGLDQDRRHGLARIAVQSFDSVLARLREQSFQFPFATSLKVLFEKGGEIGQQDTRVHATWRSESLVRVVTGHSGVGSPGFEISWDYLAVQSDEHVGRVFSDTFRNLIRHREFIRLEKQGLFRSLRHQFGNALFRVGARLGQLEDLVLGEDIESRRDRVLELVQGAARASTAAHPLLRNLSVLGGEVFQVDAHLIGDSITEAVRQAEVRAASWGVGFKVEGALGNRAKGEVYLVHALSQLFENALSAQLRCPEGEIHVRLESPAGTWKLMIRDQGPGFPSDESGISVLASRAARDAGRPGLGIPVILKILRAYGGRARVRNVESGGAEIVVELPRTI
jgi:signal transduction histidine kinase